MSKNKDKLYRKGGFHIAASNTDGFQSLVEQTNRLFLYKLKMNGSAKKQNVFNRFTDIMDKKLDKLNKIKKETKIKDEEQYEPTDKILMDINNMIHVLEKKD
jgi:hypothetical protein